MFAVTTVNWSTVGTYALHAAELLFLFALLVGFLVLVVFVVSKATGTKPAALLQKAEASPAAKDLEAIAAKAAEAAVAKFQTASPVTIPNHPAATALVDVLQKSQLANDAISKVANDLLQAQNNLAATPK